MYLNWSKIFFAFIYLLVIVLIIIIQLSLPPTWNGLLIGLFLTITCFFSAILFASNAISAFSKPLDSPNILVALAATLTGVVLVIIQVYLFILQIIDFVTINFPR